MYNYSNSYYNSILLNNINIYIYIKYHLIQNKMIFKYIYIYIYIF